MSSFDRDNPDMTSEELFERIMDIAADDRKREAETGDEDTFIRDHFQIIHVK